MGYNVTYDILKQVFIDTETTFTVSEKSETTFNERYYTLTTTIKTLSIPYELGEDNLLARLYNDDSVVPDFIVDEILLRGVINTNNNTIAWPDIYKETYHSFNRNTHEFVLTDKEIKKETKEEAHEKLLNLILGPQR
jgi:hypothetical protein